MYACLAEKFIGWPSHTFTYVKMQSVYPRIWTRVAGSISYDDIHYTTDTFMVYGCYSFTYLYIISYACMYVFMYVCM